jgi:hypothetical protein
MKNTRKKISFIILFLFLNIYIINFVKANSNYSNSLEIGTQISEVKYYDEERWNNTVNPSMDPSSWLGGEANIIGAKSKLTIIDWFSDDLKTSTTFAKFLYSNEILSIFPIVRNLGYGEEFINENYTNNYFVWGYTFHYWYFTNGEFDVQPNLYFEVSDILQNPQDLKQVLDNYNDYAGIINNDTTLQSLNISFPVFSGDDLVWWMIINSFRFPVGNPINEYLTIYIDNIGCKNVTNRDNTLLYQRRGVKNYTVEVNYNSQGLIETFLIKNLEGILIYKITSFYPKTVLAFILGIIGICIIGIVTIIITRKIKLRDHFIQKINKSKES